MKNVKLLSLLALIIALSSAFSSKKQVPIYRITDLVTGDYHFEGTLPEGGCQDITQLSCSTLVDNLSDIPASPNTEPTTGNPNPSTDKGSYLQ